LFFFSSYIFNNHQIVILFYVISIISGLSIIIKKKLLSLSIITFAILFFTNYFFSLQFQNYRGDLDSKHYTYSAARLNYNNWGQNCDEKIIDSKLINDLAKYTRLPMLAYTWTNNIYHLPIKTEQIYGISLLFTFFSIFFFAHTIKTISQIISHSKTPQIIFTVLISIAAYGGHSLESSLVGQINQSYALLISFITIYLSFNKTLSFSLKIILSTIIFFSFPEFFPCYLMYLLLSFINETESLKEIPHNLLKYFISLLPLIILVSLNLNFYLWYYNNQLNTTPGWWPILNYNPRYWPTYFFLENPVINNQLLIAIAIFSTSTSLIKYKITQNNHFLKHIYLTLIILIITAIYILVSITPNPNYASFKSTAWLFPLFTICALLVSKKSKIIHHLLISLCIFRLASFSQAYLNLLKTTNFLKINYSALIKQNTQSNILLLNDNKIDQMLSAANYNCPSKNCICKNENTYPLFNYHR